MNVAASNYNLRFKDETRFRWQAYIPSEVKLFLYKFSVYIEVVAVWTHTTNEIDKKETDNIGYAQSFQGP